MNYSLDDARLAYKVWHQFCCQHGFDPHDPSLYAVDLCKEHQDKLLQMYKEAKNRSLN